MDKLTEDIVRKAERAVDTVLNNELPIPRCWREKVHVKQRREKVKQELAVKYGVIGPSVIKETSY